MILSLRESIFDQQALKYPFRHTSHKRMNLFKIVGAIGLNLRYRRETPVYNSVFRLILLPFSDVKIR